MFECHLNDQSHTSHRNGVQVAHNCLADHSGLLIDLYTSNIRFIQRAPRCGVFKHANIATSRIWWDPVGSVTKEWVAMETNEARGFLRYRSVNPQTLCYAFANTVDVYTRNCYIYTKQNVIERDATSPNRAAHSRAERARYNNASFVSRAIDPLRGWRFGICVFAFGST